jgi:hypothetical protein
MYQDQTNHHEEKKLKDNFYGPHPMRRILEDNFGMSNSCDEIWRTIPTRRNIGRAMLDDFLLYHAVREALQDDTDDDSSGEVEADEEDDDLDIFDHLLIDMLLSPKFVT